MSYNLKHRDKLLQDIAEGLRRIEQLYQRTQLVGVEIVFYVRASECKVERYTFGLVAALEVIANDLFWDERGNWAEAHQAAVLTI